MLRTSTGIPVDGAIDIHVHLMPDRLMVAIRKALTDVSGWEFNHPTGREAIEAALREHSIGRYVALPYAHKSGMAADINEWVLAEATNSEMCIPFATVHPADDVHAVVEVAFENGARGLKFQCPVQEVAPDDPRLDPRMNSASSTTDPSSITPVLHRHSKEAPMSESTDSSSSANDSQRFGPAVLTWGRSSTKRSSTSLVPMRTCISTPALRCRRLLSITSTSTPPPSTTQSLKISLVLCYLDLIIRIYHTPTSESTKGWLVATSRNRRSKRCFVAQRSSFSVRRSFVVP